MKCFYHTDMDGKCSGAIVRHACKNTEVDETGEHYIPIDYKDEFPFASIAKDERIFIVDFSLQKNGDFERLLEITPCVIWIDHHKTAIEKHAHISEKVDGIQREDKVAGCGLAWQYFFPDKPTPRAVRLLGDYDTWTFDYGEDSKLFQIGCQLEDTHPKSSVWDTWLSGGGDLTRHIENGRMLKQYQDRANAGAVGKWAYLATFEGHTAVCCNSSVRNSQMFDSVTAPYDLMMPFIWDGKLWTVSIYSTNGIDCSELAKKHGGGGHPGAAGFQCKELPMVPK